MLYLQNTEDAQVLFVPKNGDVPSGELDFKARSTIDLDTVIDVQVVDLNVSDLYMHLAVTIPDGSPAGEYEYTVSVGDEILSTGILVIGEQSLPSEYEKTITYEQYESQ